MIDLLPALLLAAAVATNGPAAPAPAPVPPAGRPLTLQSAVLRALDNNRGLAVQRLAPLITRTAEDVERAAFDPVVAGEVANARDAGEGEKDELTAAVRATERLPTGTRITAEVNGDRLPGSEPGPDAAEAAVTLSQSLLQGRPLAVNLASLRQARIDTGISEFELRGYAEALVADVEIQYWNSVLARRRLTIVEEALAIAAQQLDEIDHRIRVGGLPETERASAQAEVALRREALINARSALALSDLRLRRLIDPAALAGGPATPEPVTAPAAPAPDPDPLEVHVKAALLKRPDLGQAELQVARNDLELVKTRNGLLPRLALFVRLGDTGYARSFERAAADIDGKDPGVEVGVQLSFPPLNREAKALNRAAELSREQAEAALENMKDLARVDVEAAFIDVQRTLEQITATATTRQFQEEKLRAEQVKFRVGRSTSLLVAQAQQDLVNSQVSEVEAVINSLQSLVRLYRLEGTLLERRGVTVAE